MPAVKVHVVQERNMPDVKVHCRKEYACCKDVL
jgi:hypothetical protein